MHVLAGLNAISPSHLLTTFGVVGVFVIMLLEMALLVAFFLPGDTLLFLAGSATVAHNSVGDHLSLGPLLIAAAAGAVIGGQFGYEVGRRAGAQLHERGDSRIFRREYVERAQRFLDRFGGSKAVVLSRFVPVVRTFASPLFGVAGMGVATYSLWNLIGGVVWTVLIILLGHIFGHVAFIRHYIELLAVVVIVFSLAPVLFGALRHRNSSPPPAG